MMELIKKHQELCEQYYEVFKKHVPFELAWHTMKYRIQWIEKQLREKDNEQN